ncbi:MAG: protein kinase, partial [Chthoniobacteraceae bacterium]
HFCQAMDYAHRQARVVHRDLKPANLMVNGRGDLKVTDFGISRSMSDSMTRVSMSNSAGTLAYMSPEQALGSPPAAGDDIYAFGATVYDLLTGRPPFFRGNLQVQLETVIPPLMEQRRTELGNSSEPIPALWEEVIAACLAKRPADRPQSMIEIANLLGVGAGSTAGTSFRFGSTNGGQFGVPGTTPTASAPGTAPTQQRTVNPDELRTEESVSSGSSKPPQAPTRTQIPPVATRQEDVLLNVAPHIASRRPSRAPSPSGSNQQPPTSATNRSAAPAPEYSPPVVARPSQNAAADEVIEPHTIRAAEPPVAANVEPAEFLGDGSAFEPSSSVQEAAPMQREAAGEYADALPSMEAMAAGQSFAPPQTRVGHQIGHAPPKPKNGKTRIVLGGLAALVLVAALGTYFGMQGGWTSSTSGTKVEPVIEDSPPEQPPSPTDAELLVAEAQKFFEADKLTDARQSLAAALKLEPESTEALALKKDVDEGIAEDELAAQKNEIMAAVDVALAEGNTTAARKALEGLPPALENDAEVLHKTIEIGDREKELAEIAAKKAQETARNNALALERMQEQEATDKANRLAKARQDEADRQAAARTAARKRTEARDADRKSEPPVRRATKPPVYRPPTPAPTTTKPKRFRTPWSGGAPGG